MSSKKPNIKDVAARLGVSTATVSYALAGKGRISSETRERVLKVAGEIGFIPDITASRLRTGRSRLLGVIVLDLTNPFFSGLVRGFQKVALEAGYLTLVGNSDDDPDLQEDLLSSFLAQGVDGLLVCPAQSTDQSKLDRFIDRGMPLIVGVRDIDFHAAGFVGPSNREVGRIAGSHLFAQGHRQVAWIGGQRGTFTLRERLAGVREAARAAGGSVPKSLVFPCPSNFEASREATTKLIDSGTQCRAVICHSDHTALGVYTALFERGLQAGRDYSVVGIDNTAQSSVMLPPLTTIETYPRAIGEHCATGLLDQLENRTKRIERTLVEPRLIERKSTAPPRGIKTSSQKRTKRT